jgi:tetratricopeptide (TPR) repeat protein
MVVTCATALSTSSSAWAQTTDRERAETHFDLGRLHVQAGHCDLAIEEFRQSIDFEPTSVGARLNLGDCYVVLGRLPEAFRQYKDAEANARLQNDARIDAARRSAAEVQAKLLRVIVRESEPAVPGAMISVDGAPAGTSPWTIVLTPGTTHVLDASAPDGRRWHAEVRGNAGDAVRFDLAAVPSSPATMTTTPPVPADHAGAMPTRGPLATVGVITSAIGLASIATGVVFGALASSSRSDLAEAVNKDPQCSGKYPDAGCDRAAAPRLQPIRDRAFMQSTIADVGFIGGAALLVGGIIMFVVAPRSSVRVSVWTGAALEGSF